MNLTDKIFTDADAARAHLESLQWANGRVCPHCGTVDNSVELKGKSTRPGVYKCRDCRKPFSVTVGTLFERSHVPLNKWVLAVHLLSSSKKGMSSHQLMRSLGVTYKTAWFMAHRIRESMADTTPTGQLGGGGKVVEVDETYWGNKQPRGSFGKRGAGGHHQMKVVSLVERGGKARSFQVHWIYGGSLRDILQKHIAPGATVHTDEAGYYRSLPRYFAKHETVNHRAKEYSRDGVTTNTVEGYFSILKRGLVGTFHHVAEHHLYRYVREFDFRYNTRTALGVSDVERTDYALKGMSGKRLTYRRTGYHA